MFDGRLNICKECTKKRVSSHREKNIDAVREYDRNRPNAKERNEKHLERMRTLPKETKERYRQVKEKWCDENPDRVIKNRKAWVEKNPEKVRQGHKRSRIKNRHKINARARFYTAKNNGALSAPEQCEYCNKKVALEGHHPDYAKALEVIWLCPPCHSAEHKRLNKIQREQS